MFQGSFRSILKYATALALCATVMWEVARHADSRGGQAIVHVMDGDVDIRIGDWERRVDSPTNTPITCELRPGRHTIQMFRAGVELYQEDFNVVPGEDIVLTAWDVKRVERLNPRSLGNKIARTVSDR
jgi:hypothetical protein